MAHANSGGKGWYIVDAADLVLGRLSTQVAILLRGKHKRDYTPHNDCGDCVIVINASRIRLTGNKLNAKFLKRYTGYPGGLKLIPYSALMATRPATVIRRSVWGMLPHTRRGRRQIRALKIYAGAEHPHVAQKPVVLKMAKGLLVNA
jgi:large subunit ribosomal protein L13